MYVIIVCDRLPQVNLSKRRRRRRRVRFGGNRDLITPGYAPAGAMLTRWALAGPARFWSPALGPSGLDLGPAKLPGPPGVLCP